MAFVSKGTGTYTIHISNEAGVGTVNKKKVSMTYKLPKQVLKLKKYRVQMGTDANSVDAKGLNISLPFLSYNHHTDSTPNIPSFPILLSSSAITLESGDDMPLYMSKDAEDTFPVSVYNSQGTIEPNINSLTLVFETGFGSF